jgi:RNA polymerase sigma factor (TIGR02999 family)
MDRHAGDAITACIDRVAAGDRDAADELLSLVYDQLHHIARERMSRERPGHTLQTTALVHEAYLRLMGGSDPDLHNRAYFFAAAARAMRRILVEHARARCRHKRGGGRPPAPVNVLDLALESSPDEILALDEALQILEAEDERAAEVVRLRFFAGLDVDETAEAMGISPRTVFREWSFARARLTQLLRTDRGDER